MAHFLAPLSAAQTARGVLRVNRRTVLAAQVSVTPLGLIAIGALVSAILLSVPPIVRAAGDVRRGRLGDDGDRAEVGPPTGEAR